jgi:hypothetical protein
MPEQNFFEYLSQTTSKIEYIHMAMVRYPISEEGSNMSL